MHKKSERKSPTITQAQILHVEVPNLKLKLKISLLVENKI